LKKETRKMLEIIRYTSSKEPKSDLFKIREGVSAFIQSFDLNIFPGLDALKILIYQTMDAASIGQLIAKTAEMDFLMRLAGSDQIEKALQVAGVKPNGEGLMVIYGTPDQVKKGTDLALRLLNNPSRFVPLKRYSYESRQSVYEVSALLGIRKGSKKRVQSENQVQ
jgi:tRNA threonylcarbamoyladenosine modification (KEOPS) complex Cgi121 subunit